MSFCLIIATAPPAQVLPTLANQAERALKNLYPAHIVLHEDWGWCSIVVSQPANDRRSPLVLNAEGSQALVSAGSWFYGNTLASGQEQALLACAHDKGFSHILESIEGVFGIALLDKKARRIEVAVDPAGSYHVYRVQLGDVLLISDSALTLAAITGAKLDPEGVHEFIATGTVYGTHALWQNFTKLPPADYLKIEAFNRRIEGRTYWHFSHIRPEKYNAKEGAARIAEALAASAKNINKHFPNALCDLTGGYDSRATLTGFLLADVKVSTTVSGSEDSPDARVAKTIADQFGLPHRRVERNSTRTCQDLLDALVLTDGEYDVFEYAGIAETHQGHVAAGHDISINGSFGELARGYWWELLMPKIGAKTPLDSGMLARKRFAAKAYTRSIFADDVAAIDLVGLLAQQVELQNHELLSFPNTTQMDHAYFSMRMQRWQGRIASSTNRIWPAVSPFAFRPILQPVLETQANARLRSLVVRTMFAHHLPALGKLPLEHGYPAMPATICNIGQFTPAIFHYGSRISERLTRRWRNAKPTVTDNNNKFISEDAQLASLLPVLHLCESGLFNADTLQKFMLAPENQGSPEQWRRLFTLEMAVAKVLQLTKTLSD